jgi:hypothetical protein
MIRDAGGRAMAYEIKTAAELIALDMEGRQTDRRAARESRLMRTIVRAFVEGTDPVRVEDIAAALQDRAAESVFQQLARLNEEDLIRMSDGWVDLAYPFSATPTSFVVDLGGRHGERYACCAIDALGLAPMLGQSVQIRSRCHHCAAALELSVDPSGPGPQAAEVMVWVGRQAEDELRACDAL